MYFYSMWRFFSRSLSGILFYQCRIRNYAFLIGLQAKKLIVSPSKFLKKGALVIFALMVVIQMKP